jgi:hypothetical protein
MPAGFESYSPLGLLRASIGDRILRWLGDPIIAGAGTSGTFVSDGFLTGTPFWLAAPFDPGGAGYWPGDTLVPPIVSVSGNTLSYTIQAGLSTTIIQCGVY